MPDPAAAATSGGAPPPVPAGFTRVVDSDAYAIAAPGDWVNVPLTDTGFDGEVARQRSAGNGRVADVLVAMRPALVARFGPHLFLIAPDGRSYVLVSATPASGPSLDQLVESTRQAVEQRGDRFEVGEATVAGKPARRMAQRSADPSISPAATYLLRQGALNITISLVGADPRLERVVETFDLLEP